MWICIQFYKIALLKTVWLFAKRVKTLAVSCDDQSMVGSTSSY